MDLLFPRLLLEINSFRTSRCLAVWNKRSWQSKLEKWEIRAAAELREKDQIIEKQKIEIADLEMMIENLEIQNTVLEGIVLEEEIETASLKKKIEDLKIEVAVMEGIILEEEIKTASLEKKTEDLKIEAAMMEGIVLEQKIKMASLEKEIEDLKIKNAALREECVKVSS